MSQPKQPAACTSLEDIRAGIDFHDRQIFEALQKRLGYVKAAVQFKANEQAIPAPERVAAMLEQRLAWAAGSEFDADFIKALYEQIIYWNIQQQILHWRSLHPESA
ncbi:isochorismate lyase [Pantoea sp. Cy-639]|jgi:isochorismate pyruvate lyase|uniref:isochorismate lyase n=1 Tax=Pantoea sp. Cy-639 TaxID=2608360 RepID=UPI001423C8A0|nr:isochorismate lyase [Pantoea sp. Cy-639]NIF18201.1 isochorismate lyase [Pantoea sp. Cy-639]